MKIIDLLNKLAIGKEVPEKIKYHTTIYYYDSFNNIYKDINNECNHLISELLGCQGIVLNDEVEIIEEDKKIQYLHYHNSDNKLEYNGRMYTMRVIDKALVEKIDELIDEVNKLKEDK